MHVFAHVYTVFVNEKEREAGEGEKKERGREGGGEGGRRRRREREEKNRKGRRRKEEKKGKNVNAYVQFWGECNDTNVVHVSVAVLQGLGGGVVLNEFLVMCPFLLFVNEWTFTVNT